MLPTNSPPNPPLTAPSPQNPQPRTPSLHQAPRCSLPDTPPRDSPSPVDEPLPSSTGRGDIFNEMLDVPAFVPLLPADPTTNEVDAILVEISLRARPLANLPPVKCWGAQARPLIELLTRVQAPFAAYLQHNIALWQSRDRSPTQLLQCTLYLLSFFAQIFLTGQAGSQLSQPPLAFTTLHADGTTQRRTLAPLQRARDANLGASPPTAPTHPPRTGAPRSRPSADIQAQQTMARKLKNAVQAAYRDDLTMASRHLFGNGLAEPSEATQRTMKAMHPHRPTPLTLPPPPPRLILDQADCLEQLIAATRGKQVRPDVFGWIPHYLAPIRAMRDTPTAPALVPTIARFMVLIATAADLPPLVARCLTTSSLVATNKLPEAQQFLRLNQGRDPSLRPISNGSVITKLALRAAIATPSVRAGVTLLQPQQLGLGAVNGPERMAHAARATYEAGGAIVVSDAANAFNSIRRQAVIDAVHRHLPRLGGLINAFYGTDSPCLFRWRDDEGVTTVSLIPSQEGVRAGCVLGSLAYGCALDPVYKALDHSPSQYLVRALTDDCVALFRPPPPLNDGSGQRDWNNFYLACAEYRRNLRELLQPLGITLNDAKSAILIPPNAPDPPPELAIPLQGLIVRDGIVIAGTPIGTPVFIAQHAATKATETIHHSLDVIGHLAKLNPQVATRIFINCVAQRFAYYARVTPPSLIPDAMTLLDQGITQIRNRILYREREPPIMAASRAARADDLTMLPIATGGLGLTKATETFPAAYIASLAACAVPLEAEALRRYLACYAEQAHLLLCHHLGGAQAITQNETLARILPLDHRSVTEGAFYLNNRTTQTPKVQAPLCHAVAMRRLGAMQADSLRILDDPSLQHLAPDAAHVALITTRSQITRHLRAPLAFRANRIDAGLFTRYLCFHLNMPQPVSSEVPLYSRDYECLLETCVRCTQEDGPPKLLDPVGNHCASGCPQAAKERYTLHNSLSRTIITFAKEAGCTTATHEPWPEAILNGQITSDQARLLFPKDANRTQNQLAQEALQVISDLSAARHDRDQGRIAQLNDTLANLQQRVSDNTQTRRPDVYLVAATGQQRVIDVTVVHPTSPSYMDATTRFLRDLHAEDERSRNTCTANRMTGQPTPRVAAAEQEKTKKYAPLIQTALLLKHRGLRSQAPKFLPCAATHEGELSPSFFELIEWLTTQYKKERKAEPSPRPDGCPVDQLTASFRTRLKDAIAVNIAAGFGGMLAASAAGMAFRID